MKPKVGIIMGSQSDLKVMRDAATVLKEFASSLKSRSSRHIERWIL